MEDFDGYVLGFMFVAVLIGFVVAIISGWHYDSRRED